MRRALQALPFSGDLGALPARELLVRDGFPVL